MHKKIEGAPCPLGTLPVHAGTTPALCRPAVTAIRGSRGPSLRGAAGRSLTFPGTRSDLSTTSCRLAVTAVLAIEARVSLAPTVIP